MLACLCFFAFVYFMSYFSYFRLVSKKVAQQMVKTSRQLFSLLLLLYPTYFHFQTKTAHSSHQHKSLRVEDIKKLRLTVLLEFEKVVTLDSRHDQQVINN